MISGYRIVDFANVNLADATEVTIAGIHSAIENNYRKPLMFCGLVIDGVEKPSLFPEVIVNGTDYSVTIYGGEVVITAEDKVTYTKTA